MKNFKIILQYDGTRYEGWQKQNRTDNTVQGKLETLLVRLMKDQGKPQDVEVNGAGRTDAGVHSWGQTANFKVDTEMNAEEMMEAMNRYLPEDIAVVSTEIVNGRFHARLNAKGKVYRYRIVNSDIPEVFDRKYVYQFPKPLDISLMGHGAEYLEGRHDFINFSSGHQGNKSTQRTIDSIKIEKSGNEIDLVFTGDGFLYHMVRIMTGTLIEIGLGKRNPEDIKKVFEGGARSDAGFMVPPQGLILEKVIY